MYFNIYILLSLYCNNHRIYIYKALYFYFHYFQVFNIILYNENFQEKCISSSQQIIFSARRKNKCIQLNYSLGIILLIFRKQKSKYWIVSLCAQTSQTRTFKVTYSQVVFCPPSAIGNGCSVSKAHIRSERLLKQFPYIYPFISC